MAGPIKVSIVAEEADGTKHLIELGEAAELVMGGDTRRSPLELTAYQVFADPVFTMKVDHIRPTIPVRSIFGEQFDDKAWVRYERKDP
jgi:hypothetical protein